VAGYLALGILQVGLVAPQGLKGFRAAAVVVAVHR
jgi:VanZ family protein